MIYSQNEISCPDKNELNINTFYSINDLTDIIFEWKQSQNLCTQCTILLYPYEVQRMARLIHE